jgi:hypothetical protein
MTLSVPVDIVGGRESTLAITVQRLRQRMRPTVAAASSVVSAIVRCSTGEEETEWAAR